LKGRNETSTGGIDVDTNLVARFGVKLGKFRVNFPDRIVCTVVMVAENTNNSHGLVVAQFHHFLRIDLEGMDAWLHKASFDVKVLEEPENNRNSMKLAA